MRKKAAIILCTIPLGAGVYFLVRSLSRRTRATDIHVTSEDLQYEDMSPGELTVQHLVDLNAADCEQLSALGLDPPSVERLIENRPYRSKLDLISRMILTEEAYSRIRDKVGVAEGREPVKVA